MCKDFALACKQAQDKGNECIFDKENCVQECKAGNLIEFTEVGSSKGEILRHCKGSAYNIYPTPGCLPKKFRPPKFYAL